MSKSRTFASEPMALPSFEGNSFQIALIDGDLVIDVIDERDGAKEEEVRLHFMDFAHNTRKNCYNIYLQNPCPNEDHSSDIGPICVTCGYSRQEDGSVDIGKSRFTETHKVRQRFYPAWDSMPEDVVYLSEGDYVRIERDHKDWIRLHYRDGELQAEVLNQD
jgi:hypothetical protein